MELETWVNKEKERASRLEIFIKDELRNMNIVARNQFIVNLFLYLEPEINALNEQGKLNE